MHFSLRYLFVACALVVGASVLAPPSQDHSLATAAEPSSAFAHRTYFYAGGNYVNTTQTPLVNESAVYMVGQIYVEKLVPHETTHKTPLVFISGDGQTLTNWLNTPDGREGWASFFLRCGYIVYLTDQAQRGNSPWLLGEGVVSQMPTVEVEKQFTAPQDFPSYPQAINHTQWPGTGRMGNPVFDAFMRAQVQSQVNSTMQALYNNASYAALLDTIGPAIVFAHSQAGSYGFQMADARPDLLKALVSLEPSGPPFIDWTSLPFAPSYFPESDSGSKLARPFGLTLLPLHYDPPIGLDASLLKHQNHPAAQADLAPCMLRVEPPRRLSNLGKVPMLFLTSESSYHAVYDYCTVKYLKQGGVEVDWIHLPDVGIRGNGHFVFMELNSQDIAEHIAPWIEKYSSTPLAASLYHTPLEIAPDQPFRRQRQGASMCGVKFYVENCSRGS